MAQKKYLSLDRLQEYDALIKTEITSGDDSTLSSAKSYTNTEIAKITNGTTVIPEAEHATTANSSTKLAAARTISLTGDASGSVSFDGSKDVSITVTVTDDSHNHVISNIDGLQTALDGKAPSSHNHDDTYYTEIEIDEKIEGLNTAISGKADSSHTHDEYLTEQVQADLSQTDSTQVDYVKGVIRKESLPEGYPYKEKSETVFLDWDGNIGDKENVNASDAVYYVKVGDTIPQKEDFVGAVIQDSFGEVSTVSSEMLYDITGGYCVGSEMFVVVSDKDTFDLYGNKLPSNGLWVAKAIEDSGEWWYYRSIIRTTETIHPMAEEFLPYEYAQVLYVDEQIANHNHDSKYDAKGAAADALASAQTYADSAAATVKNDLLNGAGTAYDTLKELGDLIDDNADAIDALETIASGKADATHGHAISDVSGLQSALDGKAASSHGTHVTFDSTNKPKMDGTAAFGTSTKVARADHVHPTDTSRASKTEFDTHVSDTTKHITSTERTNWGTAYTHSQATHAPSNAEKNIIVGIQKNGTDLTVNSSTRKVNITVPTTAADIGAAASSHTHAISDITNLQTTLNNASSAISANTSSINAHTDKITALETKVGDGFAEITSAEIQALFA